MRKIGARVSRFQLHPAIWCRGILPRYANHRIFAPPARQCLLEMIHVRQRHKIFAPLRCLHQCTARIDRLLFPLRYHAEKVAIANNSDYTWEPPYRRVVHRNQLCAISRRPHYTTKQHIGKAYILNERRPTSELRGKVNARHRLANQLILRWVLWGARRSHLACEQSSFVPDEVGVSGATAIGNQNHTVLDPEIRLRHIEAPASRS